MNEKIKELANKACIDYLYDYSVDGHAVVCNLTDMEKFAELIIQSCIDKIETYRIPVGNSASGELACEWTYAALKEIRDDIKETFGILDDRG
jgi:hypothetical protein